MSELDARWAEWRRARGDLANIDEWDKRARQAVEWGTVYENPEAIVALVAEVRRLREMIAPPCPECRDGKHGNCDGAAWDLIADEPTDCPCSDRGHKRDT